MRDYCFCTLLHSLLVLFSKGKVIRTVNDHCKVSGRQAAADLYIVRLKYRQRPDLTGVLATILPYFCCKRVTSLVLWCRYIVLLSFAQRRASPNKELPSMVAILMWHHILVVYIIILCICILIKHKYSQE